MPSDLGGLLLLLLSFVATFTVARLLSKRVRRDRERKAQEQVRKSESRQVRRRRERAKRN
jgi:hypothetical protein